MSALSVGTRFELVDSADWSAPCVACGRVNAQTFVKGEDGKRHREICSAHALQLGTERTRVLAVVTEVFVHGDGRAWVKWSALEERTEGAPPWNPDGRKLRGGFAEVASFLENLGSRKVRILP